MENKKIKVMGLVHGEFTSHTVRVVEIAKALRDTGLFEIIFSGRGPHMRFVEEGGFEWIDTNTLSGEYVLDNSEKDGIFGYYTETVVEEQYEVERELLHTHKPDIIIRDSFRELAAVVAKQYNIFDVYVQQANMSPYYRYDFIPMNMTWAENMSKETIDMERLVTAMKKQFAIFLHQKVSTLGIPLCEKTVEGVDADLVLMPDSEILFPFYDMTPNYKYIDPLLILDQKDPPKWKEEFCSSKKKKIIITGGTTGRYNHMELYKKAFDPEKYCIAIECSEEMKPDGFYGGKFEISSIINHCDLFVIHGGIGSTYLGLMQGLPMIGLYNHTEQQINSMELSKLGIAAAFDPQKVTYKELANKVDDIINDPNMIRRASKIAKMLENNHSLDNAVKYITEGYEVFKN